MKLVPRLLIVAFVAMSLALFANQAKAAQVWIYDKDGITKNLFNLGDKVQIVAYSSHVPYTIKVADPNGNLHVNTISNNPIFAYTFDNITDQISIDPDHAWTVSIQDSHGKYGVGQYEAFPEAQLGVIGLLGACFLAFGALKLKRQK